MQEGVVENVVGETEENGALADAAWTHDDDLELVIVFLDRVFHLYMVILLGLKYKYILIEGINRIK